MKGFKIQWRKIDPGVDFSGGQNTIWHRHDNRNIVESGIKHHRFAILNWILIL